MSIAEALETLGLWREGSPTSQGTLDEALDCVVAVCNDVLHGDVEKYL